VRARGIGLKAGAATLGRWAVVKERMGRSAAIARRCGVKPLESERQGSSLERVYFDQAARKIRIATTDLSD
jgi:hypothetical protein